MKKKGFTLVELISVVVIIAVLAVLIVPNVINMVIEGKKKILIVEEQQILVSSNLYLEDYCIHPLKGNTCQNRNHMYYIGDVNSDGSVNMHDSLLIKKYSLNTIEDGILKMLIKDRGDINSDGLIDEQDQLEIQKIAAHNIVSEKVYFCLSEIKDKKYVSNTELISGIECNGFIEYTYNEGKYTKGKTYVQCADEYQTEGIENKITQEGKYAIEECGGTKPGEEIEIPTTPGDEKLVEVKLDAQGGNVNPQKIEVVLNENYSILPEAIKEGYTFVGWYTDPTDGVKITNETKVINEVNHTLYARYSSKVLHVVFHSNRYDGDDYTAEQDFVYLQSGNRFGYNTDGNPKWDQTGQFGSWNYTGHTLLGWNKQKNAYTQTYTPYNNVTDEWIIKNDSPVDLYAVWVENSASYLEKVQGTPEAETNFLSTDIKRKDINSITFINTISGHNAVDTNTWDVGQVKNGTVLAWISSTESSGRINLVIGSEGGVLANPDSSNLFKQLRNAVSINFNHYFSTSNVTNMSSMFYYCRNLASLDLSNFDTSSVTNMNQMFWQVINLRNLDLSSFDTSNVIRMDEMFFESSNLESIIFGNRFNTSKVTNMSWMFSDCRNLISLNLSMFNTSNVTNMRDMFSNCTNLQSINFGENFNTSKVTNMSSMFYQCRSLTSLDLSSFNTSKVTNTDGMFDDCPKLTTIFVSESWNMSKVTESANMFLNSTSLVGGLGTVYDSNHIDKSYAHIDGGTSNPGYLTDINGIVFLEKSNDSGTGSDNFLSTTIDKKNINSITFVNSISGHNSSNANTWDVGSIKNGTVLAWVNGTTNGKTNLVIGKNGGVKANPDSSGLFAGMTNLKTIDFNNNFDTSFVTNMQEMFVNCEILSNLNLSSFNTINVTSMSFMFYQCKSLTSLDLSSFNTINVTSMWSMFRFCNNLQSIDFGNNYNTSNTVDMASMFLACNKLTSLDLSSFDTSNVTDMAEMFKSCVNLKTIYVSNKWNVDKVTYDLHLFEYEMFDNCTSLIGGHGTRFDSNHINKDYAHVDYWGNPGYLTYKSNNDVNLYVANCGGVAFYMVNTVIDDNYDYDFAINTDNSSEGLYTDYREYRRGESVFYHVYWNGIEGWVAKGCLFPYPWDMCPQSGCLG